MVDIQHEVTIKVLFNEKQYFNVNKKTEGERNRPVRYAGMNQLSD